MKKRAHYNLRLYIAGSAPNSTMAVANLHALCAEFLVNQPKIEIVDVLLDPQRALDEGILLTPMLVKLSPGPVRKIVGNLKMRQPVLQTLGLPSSSL